MNRYDPAARITRAEQASAAAANTIRSIDMTLTIVGTEPQAEAPIFRYARNHWATALKPQGFPPVAVTNRPHRPLALATLDRMNTTLTQWMDRLTTDNKVRMIPAEPIDLFKLAADAIRPSDTDQPTE